jgi:hypothetical protein
MRRRSCGRRNLVSVGLDLGAELLVGALQVRVLLLNVLTIYGEKGVLRLPPVASGTVD